MTIQTSIAHGWASICHSANLMRNHLGSVAGIMALDGAFLISLGVITELFGNRVIESLLALSAQLIPPSAASPELGSAALTGGAAQPLILQTLLAIMIMAIAALASFCLLQGMAWNIAYRISGRPQSATSFIARFSRVSFALFPAYLLYESLGFLSDFNELSAQRLSGLNLWNPSILVPIIGIVLGYYTIIVFSKMESHAVKDTFAHARILAFNNVTRTIPLMIPFIGLLALVEAIDRFAINYGTFGAVVGAMVLLGSMTLARIALIRAFESLPPTNNNHTSHRGGGDHDA